VIYFYYGNSDFLIRQKVDSHITKFVKENGVDSVTKINADEIDSTQLISEIVNINMFAPRRLIVVRGAESLKSTWEKLSENLSRIPDETDLIIVAKSPDKRTKAFKDLQKYSDEKREFLNPKPYELSKFILDEANLRRVEINNNAIARLIEITSGDGENQLSRIVNEIEKMSMLSKVIDVNLIDKVVESDISASVFAIFELSLSGRREEVKREIEILRNSGENANKFFGLLMSQIFALAAAIFGDDKITELKINPYQLRAAKESARRLGDNSEQKERVKSIVKQAAETDAKMKLSNHEDSWVLVEIMLMTI